MLDLWRLGRQGPHRCMNSECAGGARKNWKSGRGAMAWRGMYILYSWIRPRAPLQAESALLEGIYGFNMALFSVTASGTRGLPIEDVRMIQTAQLGLQQICKGENCQSHDWTKYPVTSWLPALSAVIASNARRDHGELLFATVQHSPVEVMAFGTKSFKGDRDVGLALGRQLLPA